MFERMARWAPKLDRVFRSKLSPFRSPRVPDVEEFSSRIESAFRSGFCLIKLWSSHANCKIGVGIWRSSRLQRLSMFKRERVTSLTWHLYAVVLLKWLHHRLCIRSLEAAIWSTLYVIWRYLSICIYNICFDICRTCFIPCFASLLSLQALL